MTGVRVITHSTLRTFADAVYAYRDRAKRLWMISPWLGTEDRATDPLLLLLDAVRNGRCDLTIVTRRPTATWHSDALQVIKANARATFFYCNSLHSKLYILECDGFRMAMFGSPNLTPRANEKNKEVAVEFRTTVSSPADDVAQLISELTQYARDICGEDDVELVQDM